MKKKWYLMFASVLLASGIAAGCNDDEDPAPPPEDPREEKPSVENPKEKAEELEEEFEGENEN